MKTQNQMFAEFQREFDKKRLKDFWGAILFLETILAMIAACFVIAIFMPDSKVDDVRPPFFVLGGMAILFLIFGFVFPLFHEKHNPKSEFHVDNIIARLVEEQRILLDKKTAVEEYLKAATAKANNDKIWVDYFYNSPESEARQEKFPGGLANLVYVIPTAEESARKEIKLEEQFDSIQKLIDNLENKRDFYYLHTNEKTFAQYLKSFKWLKRIKGGK